MIKKATPKPTAVITTATDKLRSLDVFPDRPERPESVRENAEIFEKFTTVDSIGQECGKRQWGVGGGQFVFFHLEALLEKDPAFKARFLEEAKEVLGGMEIRPEHIEEYFQIGADAGFTFMMIHEKDYDRKVRLAFDKKADQFALDKMREWLGFSDVSEQAELAREAKRTPNTA